MPSPVRRLPRPLAVCLAAVLLAPAAVACVARPARALHLSDGCGDGRRIALTFDDGPNPPWTARILDVLRERGVMATFFDIGTAAATYPGGARTEAAAGMEVGSHSSEHADDLAQRSRAGFADDLARADRALTEALGFSPRLFRAPHGWTSDAMLEALRAAGYVSVGWDVDSRDWSDATADEIVANVLSQAHPNAIVLLHDGGASGGNPDRSKTLAALPRIIDGLGAQGYEFATVSEISGAPEGAGGRTVTACSAS